MYSLKNGLVLCGTEGGLILHDGFRFTEVKMDRYEAVNDIHAISDSRLLLVRENTLVEFDLKQWSLHVIYRGSANKNEVFFASIRVGDNIYLGSSAGLQRWNIHNGKMEYLTTQFMPDGSTRSRSLSYNKKDHEVIFGVKTGVIVYNTRTERASALEIDTTFRCVLAVKYGTSYYVVASSLNLFVKHAGGPLTQVHFKQYFDSGFKATNVLEFNNKLLFTTQNHGTLIFDLQTGTFIQNDPLFGPINKLTAVHKNDQYRQLVAGTTAGLVTLAEPPKTFTVVKDSLPTPVYACQAVFDKTHRRYYYLSDLSLIEFDLVHPGYSSYDLSGYLLDNKYATIRLFDQNTLVIFGHKHVFFDLNRRQPFVKAIFSTEMEKSLDNDLIIDSYTSPDKKIVMFSTYHSGLFVKDGQRDTQYIFLGSKLGGFNTICKIHALSDHEFLMGANSFGGVYYLDISTFKVKYFPPEVFDQHSVSKSYVRNIYELDNTTYFTTVNAIWEYDKSTKNIFFSQERSQIREGPLFFLEDGKRVFLTGKHRIMVQTKDGLSLIHNGQDTQGFAFLVPLKHGAGVYSKHKLLSINLGSQVSNLNINVCLIALENRLVPCDEQTKEWVCRYDDPLLNLAFFVNYPLFNVFEGSIWYRVNNMESWQRLQGNSLNFSGMKPGKYLIKYFAKLKGEKSAIKSFTLIINPPWYQSTLFEVFVFLVLVSLTIFIVYYRLKSARHKKLKEIEIVLNSLEAERARLSKDLHDGVGPNLSALKMILNNADLDTSKFTINPNTLIDATLSEIKEILHNITPETLKQNGLASSISSYITSVPYDNIKVNFNSTLLGVRYNESIEINVYRIFQEVFNNACKYSGCKEIQIEMFVVENQLNLLISDDGKGFDPAGKHNGFGLQNIKSRVELIHGIMNMDSSEKSGTTFIIKVPVDAHT